MLTALRGHDDLEFAALLDCRQGRLLRLFDIGVFRQRIAHRLCVGRARGECSHRRQRDAGGQRIFRSSAENVRIRSVDTGCVHQNFSRVIA